MTGVAYRWDTRPTILVVRIPSEPRPGELGFKHMFCVRGWNDETIASGEVVAQVQSYEAGKTYLRLVGGWWI